MNTESDAQRPSPIKERLGRLRANAPWLFTWRFRLAALAAFGMAGLIGAAAGYIAAKRDIPAAVRANLVEPGVRSVRTALGMPQEYAWRRVTTQLGAFEMVRFPIASPAMGAMAALAELDEHLLIMTRRGDFIQLSPTHALRDFEAPLPMHTDALRAANLGVDFELFRTLDLLAIATAPHTYDLYASYNQFDDAQRCFRIVVSRMRILVDGEQLTSQSGWEDIFATQPCVPPRTTEGVFIGIQSGGRLELLNERTLLLSVGDLEFDGVNYRDMQDAYDGPQDPDSDLGKIVAIDLASGRAERIASGLRNPQGLAVDAQGRIWETEHGPFGGDEINLIRPGANYGWPIVTYGMSYNPQGENWPLNPTHGLHEGYERPAYVYVPSIGISQLVQPSTEEFPFWDNVLLVTSLRSRNLWLTRVDGDRIIYSEPHWMEQRLRDIINRSNGEIAMISDEGSLYLMRAPEEAPAPLTVADRRGRARTTEARLTAVDAGRQVFATNCQSCHTISGQGRSGPPLSGVVGRDIASVNYPFSAALRNAPGAWTESRLTTLLTRPESPFPGSAMPAPQLSPRDARNVVAYLRTTRAGAAPGER